MQKLSSLGVNLFVSSTKKDLPKCLNSDELCFKNFKSRLELIACNYLTILLINVYEVPLKALIHHFGNVPEVKLKQCVKVQHLKAIVIKDAFTCRNL